MSPVAVVLLGFFGLFTLIVLHVPIGFAMMIVGAAGFAYFVGTAPALSIFGNEVAANFSNADLASVPVFLLMGGFASAAGLSADLYRFADAFVGHRRGGLAVATIGGCAGFGALCGSTLATVGSMHRIAYPEMVNRNYAPHFAAATIAVGGTLGILVPPSIIMVIYGVLTETFVVDLYVAAIVPSVMAVLFYVAAVQIYCRLWPEDAPRGERASWRKRAMETFRTWGVLIMVLAVTGGLYAGFFTALEAAAVGATTAFAFYVFRGHFTTADFMRIMRDTATTAGLIYVMVIGASVFNYFISVSQLPSQIILAIETLNVSPVAIIAVILVTYIVLGAFFDEVATMLITLPFVMPLIHLWGYDPLWWGIVNVTVVMIGLYCPPIGLNVMVMHGLVKGVPLRRIYHGSLPYLVADFLRLAILVAVPAIATWLPSTMK